MIIINGKSVLRIGGVVYHPGANMDIDKKTADKLVKAGMATAMIEPEETAMKPKTGGRKRASSNTTNRGADKPRGGKTPPKS